jgi:hypothetical protein
VRWGGAQLWLVCDGFSTPRLTHRFLCPAQAPTASTCVHAAVSRCARGLIALRGARVIGRQRAVASLADTPQHQQAPSSGPVGVQRSESGSCWPGMLFWSRLARVVLAPGARAESFTHTPALAHCWLQPLGARAQHCVSCRRGRVHRHQRRRRADRPPATGAAPGARVAVGLQDHRCRAARRRQPHRRRQVHAIRGG